MVTRNMAIAIFALLVSAGCAQIEKSNAMDTERTLAAAAFQMKFAKTPQQIALNEEAASMNWGAWGAWGPWY